MHSTVSGFSIIISIFTSPNQAFQTIQQRYPVVLPLSTLLIVNTLLLLFVFYNLDYNWYTDHFVESIAGDLSRAEQDQQRLAMELMGIKGFAGMGIAMTLLGTPLVFSLHALYFVFVSNLRDDGFRFKQWFSLVCWSSMPSLIGLFASFFVVLIATNGQIVVEDLNPLSLNALFFKLNASQGLGGHLAAFDLTMLWSIALMTLGYANWTQLSYLKALFLVIAPYLVLFGVTILFL